ncbi:hypothetical protein JCM10213_005409 [Rhodosporidiobolus nylandii]
MWPGDQYGGPPTGYDQPYAFSQPASGERFKAPLQPQQQHVGQARVAPSHEEYFYQPLAPAVVSCTVQSEHYAPPTGEVGAHPPPAPRHGAQAQPWYAQPHEREYGGPYGTPAAPYEPGIAATMEESVAGGVEGWAQADYAAGAGTSGGGRVGVGLAEAGYAQQAYGQPLVSQQLATAGSSYPIPSPFGSAFPPSYGGQQTQYPLGYSAGGGGSGGAYGYPHPAPPQPIQPQHSGSYARPPPVRMHQAGYSHAYAQPQPQPQHSGQHGLHYPAPRPALQPQHAGYGQDYAPASLQPQYRDQQQPYVRPLHPQHSGNYAPPLPLQPQPSDSQTFPPQPVQPRHSSQRQIYPYPLAGAPPPPVPRGGYDPSFRPPFPPSSFAATSNTSPPEHVPLALAPAAEPLPSPTYPPLSPLSPLTSPPQQPPSPSMPPPPPPGPATAVASRVPMQNHARAVSTIAIPPSVPSLPAAASISPVTPAGASSAGRKSSPLPSAAASAAKSAAPGAGTSGSKVLPLLPAPSSCTSALIGQCAGPCTAYEGPEGEYVPEMEFDPSRNPADPFVPLEKLPGRLEEEGQDEGSLPKWTVSSSVLVAAEYRRKLGVIDLTGTRQASTSSSSSSSGGAPLVSPDLAPPPPAAPAARALRTKPCVTIAIVCASEGCGKELGRLMLRGQEVDQPRGDSPALYASSFLCPSCAPLPPPPPKRSSSQTEEPMADEARYATLLSGHVDAYLGFPPDVEGADTRPPPAGVGKVLTGFVAHEAGEGEDAKRGKGPKKRAAAQEGTEGVLVCDICHRDVASGFLSLAAPGGFAASSSGVKTGKPVKATSEVVCKHCDGRYLRCSDCGGGGSGKGVGRWRSRELFPDGRRTCILNHGRPVPVPEMIFDVHPLSLLHASQLPAVLAVCKSFFFKTAFLTAAIPELCEGVSPIARSFEELEKVAVDLWACFESIIRGEADSSFPNRRYLAFYWSPPPTQGKRMDSTSSHRRRKSTAAQEDRVAQDRAERNEEALDAGEEEVQVVRKDKVLAGLILAEHDLPTSNLHLCFHLPFSVGEAGLALGRLTQVLATRAQSDLLAQNAERALAGLDPYPEIKTVWTVRLNKRDSRLMSRATRRDWTSLDEYLRLYPDVEPSYFPPYRKLYLTPELLHGWCIYASRVEEEADTRPTQVTPNEVDGLALT